MTVYRTVGVGGNFANWQAAWEYLQTIDPLTDNYEFEQISDVTEIGWPVTPDVELNSFYVKFYCPWENCHQGDPTRGYKTYITTGMTMGLRGNGAIDSQVIVGGLFFDRTDGINQNVLYLGSWFAASMVNVQTYRLNNLIFKSTTTAANGGRAIRATSSRGNAYHFSNNKIKLFNQGISTFIGAGAGAEHVIEHCSIDECGEGIGWGVSERWDIKNCVCVNCATQGWGTLGGGGYNNLYNCADDDGSLGASGANLIDCIQNITPADEFQSTDFNNPNWLKLNDGTYT